MNQVETDLKRFLKDSTCLVVDPSSTFSTVIQSCLQSQGISANQTHWSRKFQDAKKIVQEKKPRLIITEYQIDNGFGIELFEMQYSQYEQSERISFIMTLNSTDSAVAEAAEGQVDGYILKPFPMDLFQKKMIEIVQQKLNPSEYLLKVNSGKMLFSKNEFDAAAEEFRMAKKMNSKPALACFYAGLCWESKGEYAKALKEYQEGRQYQPLHYNCLTGEFDASIAIKKYHEAYALIEPIESNFPITARRLGNMFVAAVYTNHFDDLLRFYEIYNRIDQRSPHLVSISSMALFTAGRHFIKQKDFKKASIYFDLCLVTAGRPFSLLERVVLEFVKVKAYKEAEAAFSKANSTDIGTEEHRRLDFQVSQLILTPDQMIERGRKLIFAGLGTPDIFQAVVIAMAKQGKETLAESVISKASESDPSLGPALYKVLAENLTKSG